MKSTRAAWRVFETAFLPWMRRRTHLHVSGVPAVPASGRILLCANHESWWDGFVAQRIQQLIRPGASFHAVMLSSELSRRPFLRALGAVGVEPGSVASGRTLLRRLASLPEDAVLAYFPQGVLRPGSPRPLAFRAGIGSVIDAFRPAAVLPVGLRVLPGRTSRQEIFVSVGRPVSAETTTAPALEAVVAKEVDAIERMVRTHGERTPDVWPADPRIPLPRRRRLAVGVRPPVAWPSRN